MYLSDLDTSPTWVNRKISSVSCETFGANWAVVVGMLVAVAFAALCAVALLCCFWLCMVGWLTTLSAHVLVHIKTYNTDATLVIL